MTNDENIHPVSSGIRNPESGIRIVGIIGEGKMGTSIFYHLLEFPFSLRWIGSTEADTDHLQKQVEKKLRRSVKCGIMNQEEHDRRIQHVVISRELKCLSDCDLVIEAIPEEEELKRHLFKALDEITPPTCILASNSSSINPSKLFIPGSRDSYIIGIHYFYPVPLRETVELILTEKTSPETHEKAESFLIQSGKQILKLNERNSFILNRLFLDIQNEAYRIIEQGKATESQLDNLVKEQLFPIGIFDFMDCVGIDTMLTAIRNYTAEYPHQDYFEGLISRLQQYVMAGKLGQKSGEGFYRYQDNPAGNSGSNIPLSAESAREIAEHLRFTYLNAAKRFTMQSRCTIDEMNTAIKEYFGLEKGPFE